LKLIPKPLLLSFATHPLFPHPPPKTVHPLATYPKTARCSRQATRLLSINQRYQAYGASVIAKALRGKIGCGDGVVALFTMRRTSHWAFCFLTHRKASTEATSFVPLSVDENPYSCSTVGSFWVPLSRRCVPRYRLSNFTWETHSAMHHNLCPETSHSWWQVGAQTRNRSYRNSLLDLETRRCDNLSLLLVQ